MSRLTAPTRAAGQSGGGVPVLRVVSWPMRGCPTFLAALLALLIAPAAALAGPLDGVREYLQTREGVVQVAVFDKATRTAHAVSTGSAPQYTASIQKVDILAGWLRRYEDVGTAIPRGIPYSVKYLMTDMITASSNDAATGLFFFGGGCTYFGRFNGLIGMPRTRVGCQTPTYYGWGNTTTSAPDQVRLMRMLAYGLYQQSRPPKAVLGPRARNYALGLMRQVEPGQSWGITCGPWGTACDAPAYAQQVSGVHVARKNGWKPLPTCTATPAQCPWQVNSTGWVRGQGRDYVITVLTTRNPAGAGVAPTVAEEDSPGFRYGIATVQGVSQMVWRNLG